MLQPGDLNALYGQGDLPHRQIEYVVKPPAHPQQSAKGELQVVSGRLAGELAYYAAVSVA